MKDYTDFIIDAAEWQKNRPRFLIDKLLPEGTTDNSAIAGKMWKGKTNLALDCADALSTGEPFLGFNTVLSKVAYFDFEGNPVNIAERLEKVVARRKPPAYGYLRLENLKEKRFILHNNINHLVDLVQGAEVVFIDGGKHLIAGEYIKPIVVKQFGEDLLKAGQLGKFTTILTWQIKKPHDETRITPGDLFTLKGAADLVEDAMFVILLESPEPHPRGRGQPWYHPPQDHVDIYISKAKESDIDFKEPFLETRYDKNTCAFVIR